VCVCVCAHVFDAVATELCSYLTTNYVGAWNGGRLCGVSVGGDMDTDRLVARH